MQRNQSSTRAEHAALVEWADFHRGSEIDRRHELRASTAGIMRDAEVSRQAPDYVPTAEGYRVYLSIMNDARERIAVIDRNIDCLHHECK